MTEEKCFEDFQRREREITGELKKLYEMGEFSKARELESELAELRRAAVRFLVRAEAEEILAETERAGRRLPAVNNK